MTWPGLVLRRHGLCGHDEVCVQLLLYTVAIGCVQAPLFVVAFNRGGLLRGGACVVSLSG